VEIEWATICREYREREEGEDWLVDLLGVIQDAVAIYAPLPQEVTVNIAVVVRSDHAEVAEGGVVTLLYVALDPDGQPIYKGTATYGASAPPAVYLDSPRRAVLPLTATVPVTRDGLYRIAIGLAVDEPPYVVECRMIEFPSLEE